MEHHSQPSGSVCLTRAFLGTQVFRQPRNSAPQFGPALRPRTSAPHFGPDVRPDRFIDWVRMVPTGGQIPLYLHVPF